jgi:hypothetical protein
MGLTRIGGYALLMALGCEATEATGDAGSDGTTTGASPTTSADDVPVATSSVPSTGTTDDSGGDDEPPAAESGSTGDDDGGTTGPREPCPPFDPPATEPTLKFDVVTFSCAAGQTECPADDDKCLCSNLFDALNVGPPHYIAMGTDAHRSEVLAAGNALAVYVDDLNTDWMDGGPARAAKMIADAEADFACGVPDWFVINEISAGNWPDNAAYRQYVIDVATELDVVHGKHALIASPFSAPGANAASWDALADHAWIGAENYLSGQQINATGNQVVWCVEQYQTSVNAYTSKGVPMSRLVLFEHFGGTLAGTNWGRAGVSDAGWINAITTRSEAAAQLGLAGFASYAWGSNLVHEDEPGRIGYVDTYTALSLP